LPGPSRVINSLLTYLLTYLVYIEIYQLQTDRPDRCTACRRLAGTRRLRHGRTERCLVLDQDTAADTRMIPAPRSSAPPPSAVGHRHNRSTRHKTNFNRTGQLRHVTELGFNVNSRFYQLSTTKNTHFDAHYCHIGTAIKHPVPDRVKPSFVIFDIWALWRWALSVRVPECQKLQTTA